MKTWYLTAGIAALVAGGTSMAQQPAPAAPAAIAAVDPSLLFGPRESVSALGGWPGKLS